MNEFFPSGFFGALKFKSKKQGIDFVNSNSTLRVKVVSIIYDKNYSDDEKYMLIMDTILACPEYIYTKRCKYCTDILIGNVDHYCEQGIFLPIQDLPFL